MSVDAPLIYPPHYPPTDRWKRFFLGVRWLGPDLSFFGDLRATQASRTAQSIDAWGGGDRQALAITVCAAFSRHLRWPTPYFLPTDSVAVIAGGPKFTNFDEAEDVVDEIEERMGVKLGDSFWSAAGSGTLGQLVDRLLSATVPPHDKLKPKPPGDAA